MYVCVAIVRFCGGWGWVGYVNGYVVVSGNGNVGDGMFEKDEGKERFLVSCSHETDKMGQKKAAA